MFLKATNTGARVGQESRFHGNVWDNWKNVMPVFVNKMIKNHFLFQDH